MTMKDKAMNSSLKTINGSEDLQDVDDNRLRSLITFHAAFNQRNLQLMRDIWLNSDEASMNNPAGGIMRGWKNIEAVYNRIFNGGSEVFVEFYDFTMHSTERMFLVTGRERGFFGTADIKIDLSIRTSRVFVREENGWKQLHHHGSIDDPALLKSYQSSLVRNGE